MIIFFFYNKNIFSIFFNNIEKNFLKLPLYLRLSILNYKRFNFIEKKNFFYKNYSDLNTFDYFPKKKTVKKYNINIYNRWLDINYSFYNNNVFWLNYLHKQFDKDYFLRRYKTDIFYNESDYKGFYSNNLFYSFFNILLPLNKSIYGNFIYNNFLYNFNKNDLSFFNKFCFNLSNNFIEKKKNYQFLNFFSDIYDPFYHGDSKKKIDKKEMNYYNNNNKFIYESKDKLAEFEEKFFFQKIYYKNKNYEFFNKRDFPLKLYNTNFYNNTINPLFFFNSVYGNLFHLKEYNNINLKFFFDYNGYRKRKNINYFFNFFISNKKYYYDLNKFFISSKKFIIINNKNNFTKLSYSVLYNKQDIKNFNKNFFSYYNFIILINYNKIIFFVLNFFINFLFFFKYIYLNANLIIIENISYLNFRNLFFSFLYKKSLFFHMGFVKEFKSFFWALDYKYLLFNFDYYFYYFLIFVFFVLSRNFIDYYHWKKVSKEGLERFDWTDRSVVTSNYWFDSITDQVIKDLKSEVLQLKQSNKYNIEKKINKLKIQKRTFIKKSFIKPSLDNKKKKKIVIRFKKVNFSKKQHNISVISDLLDIKTKLFPHEDFIPIDNKKQKNLFETLELENLKDINYVASIFKNKKSLENLTLFKRTYFFFLYITFIIKIYISKYQIFFLIKK